MTNGELLRMKTHTIIDPVYQAQVLVCLDCSEEDARGEFMRWYIKTGGVGALLWRDTASQGQSSPVLEKDGGLAINVASVDETAACGYIPSVGRYYGVWVGRRCGEDDPIERITCISHEVTHFAVGVMNHVGIPITVGKDEAMAYYHQFLLREILKRAYPSMTARMNRRSSK